MDAIHKATKTIDHNRYAALGLLLAAGISAWLLGCSSRTLSLKPDLAEQGRKVTRLELKREAAEISAGFDARRAAYLSEIQAFQARLEAARADLDRQDKLKRRIAQALPRLVAEVGAPPGLGSLLASALGVTGLAAGGGLLLDNRRKDKVIRRNKENASNA